MENDLLTPKLGHHIIARLLRSKLVEYDRDLDKVRKYYGITSLDDLALQSTEAEFLYSCYVCANCASLHLFPSCKLMVGACVNCARIGKPFWSASQYRADWLNRSIRKISTFHKRMIMRSLYEGKYL